MNENEIVMIIETDTRGKCGYCRKDNASRFSLTFLCHICDHKCDAAYWEEYLEAERKAAEKNTDRNDQEEEPWM